MYTKYEPPVISATIFYYDLSYQTTTAQTVLAILEEFGMFPPEKIHAGKLTNNRYLHADEYAKALLTHAYSEKDILGIGMASGDSRQVVDFWKIDWTFTYYKCSRRVGACQVLPWNTLTIQSTYGRLRDKSVLNSFLMCLRELIRFIEPFYAAVDDVSHKVAVMNHVREQHFVPDRIQAIYWGNYFGRQHCEKYGLDRLSSMPAYDIETLGQGIFFTLSESPLDFDTKETAARRKKITRFLPL